jgi:AcrR family transcriptional regulator
VQQLTSPPVGLRESKKLATRRALTAAARELIQTQGLDAVTVEMICDQVAVSIRTFFNYFESKEAAALGEDTPLADDAQVAFVAGGPTGGLLTDLVVLLDPTAALEAAGRDQITTLLALMTAEPRILVLQIGRDIDREMQLARLIAARRGLPDADPACSTIAAVAQTTIRRGCFDWFTANDGRPLRDHLDRSAAALRDLLAD